MKEFVRKQIGIFFQNLCDSFQSLFLRFFSRIVFLHEQYFFSWLFSARFTPFSSAILVHLICDGSKKRRRIFEETRNEARQEGSRGIFITVAEELSAVVLFRCALRWKRSSVRNYWRLLARLLRKSGDLIPSVALITWFLWRIKDRRSLYQLWRSVRFRENRARCTKAAWNHEWSYLWYAKRTQ